MRAFLRRGVLCLGGFVLLPGALSATGGGAAPGTGIALETQPRRNLRVVANGATTTVPIRRFGGTEMVQLSEIASALGGGLRDGDHDQQVVLLIGGQAIRFDAGRSFVDVAGTTRVLRDPAVRRGGAWYVPLDFVDRVLPDIIPGGTRYSRRTRTLVVGEDYPRLNVDVGARPGVTRVGVEVTPPVPMRLEEEGDRLVISIDAPFVETAFPGAAPADGVVERVDLARTGGAYRLEITTGEHMGRFTQERGDGRFAIEFIRSGIASGDVLVPRAPEEPDLPRPPSRRGPRDIRLVAIDPGHGGQDLGAAAGEQATEKDITLAVALALRERLVNSYGLEVILTRDSDRELALDDRAVVANAARADLLVSLHLNASPSASASGSLVVHLSPTAAVRGDSGAAIRFVPWRTAQAVFVPESRLLAEALAAELEGLDIPASGVADAPLRLLGGAAMPAVHVELGFVTSETDRELLLDPAFHLRLADALARGILRYRSADAGMRETGSRREPGN